MNAIKRFFSWIFGLGAPVVDTAINLAVGAVVGTNKADMKQRAIQLKSVTQQILARSNEVTNMSVLTSLLNAKVLSLNLPAPDIALAQTLVQALEAVIAVKVGATPEVAAIEATVQNVCTQVIQTCSFYGA